MIQLTYDMQADALAIQLQAVPRGTRAYTMHPIPGVGLDVDAKGRVYALEVLDASARIPREILEALPSPREYLTLAEAAKESGLSAGTLRVQINNGRIAAIKRGRDWFIDSTALINYLESRDAHRCRAAKSRTHPGKRAPRPGKRKAAVKPAKHAA